MNKPKIIESTPIIHVRKHWNYISLVIIALLLLLNLFLMRFYLQYSRKAIIVTDDNVEVRMTIRELEVAYNEKFQAYEMLKKDNFDRTAEIEQLEQLLLQDKERINELAEQGASAELIRAEVGKLRKASDEEIAKLTRTVAGLESTNTQLIKNNDEMISQSKLQARTITVLATQKDSIEKLARDAEVKRLREQKEKALEDVASTKQQKIKNAHLLVGNIKITTINSNGREKNKANKVKSIRACFVSIPDADNLVSKGLQSFYFQIIDPLGAPVEISNSEMLRLSNGTVVRSAIRGEIEYDTSDKEHCVTLNLDANISAGNYKLIFFHNLNRSGQQGFSLK